jgi:hypothetical protein
MSSAGKFLHLLAVLEILTTEMIPTNDDDNDDTHAVPTTTLTPTWR